MRHLSIQSVKVFLLFVLSYFIKNDCRSQVNLQTGSATFSLPMFNWDDSKSRLTSVVALNYNSGSGLKVNDIASNVGQGWSMLSGGVISRMQVGEPDDQIEYGLQAESDLKKFPAGFLNTTVPILKGCPIALTKYPIYKEKNQYYAQHNKVGEDKQLDYFNFQFNGKSGLFVLDPRSTSGVGISLGDTKVKITFTKDPDLKFTKGVRTTITSFTIQDVDGLKYKFSRHGLTKVLKTDFTELSRQRKRIFSKRENNGINYQKSFDEPSASPWTGGEVAYPYVIDNWYLTEVEDPFTLRKISFTYEDRSINSPAGIDLTYNKDENNLAVITEKTSVTITPEITGIVYPDGHQVSFNYGSLRADYQGAKVLSSVDIKYQERFISKYKFNTTYFIRNRYGTPVNETQKSSARLCLKSVQKIGVDLKEDTPPFIFDYYLGSNSPDDFIPPPFFYAKDIWGYFNGDFSKNSAGGSVPLNKSVFQLSFGELKGLCFYRDAAPGALVINPKSGYAKNGLLKQIIYPTGGTLSYDYEQNAGVVAGQYQMVGGVHVLKTSSTDGGFSNNCDNPITTQYNYVLESGTQSSLWGLETPRNDLQMNSYYEPEYKTWHYRGGIFGTCYYKFFYPGIQMRAQAINLNTFQNIMNSQVMDIIGVVSTIVDVVTLVCYSSGVLAWAAVIVDIAAGLFAVGFTCAHDYRKNTSTTVYYNSDLNGVSPLPAQFKRVEVVEGTGGIGKKVHLFTSSDDYQLWYPEGQNPELTARQRFAPWAYGLPKQMTILDVTGKKIKQVENQYNFENSQNLIGYVFKAPTNASGFATDLVSCKCLVERSISQRSTNWRNESMYNAPEAYQLGSNSDMKVRFYGFYTGRTLLSKTYERTFKIEDQNRYVETVTEYNYDDYENFELTSTRTSTSEGDFDYKYFHYNYSKYGGVYDVLRQNNVRNLIIETTDQVYKTDLPGGTTSEKKIDFVQLANGDIQPSQISERKYAQPFQSGTAPAFLPTQTFIYNGNGMRVGSKDDANRVVASIYDYDEKYVVASIVNADPLLDKAAYTSFETASLGGWSLNGTPSYATTNVITGSRGLLLGSQSISTNLNIVKPYILSLWATSPVSVAGNASLVKTGPVVNGFTYYEYNITQGTSNVVISGNVSIDELRLYPTQSRMQTITYDPLIGKTSECDENNRITYYEYDNLGRLKFIKDEVKNIIKMYEYNNVSSQKQNGCPAIYYNKEISEVFTKSNCGSGYLGSTTAYNIPANKYSSLLSQQDADAKAENELWASGQVTADASNGCSLIYYNDVRTRTGTSESCDPGAKGGLVTYTVPANVYSSIISKADANRQADDELDANADAYINSWEHRVCTVTTDPDWTHQEGAPKNCSVVNGENRLILFETDLNPNSPTYGGTRWNDVGVQAECPAIPCSLAFNWASGISYTHSNISLNGYTVNFNLVFTLPSGATSITVGNLAGSCTYPTSERIVPVSIGSAIFHVIIATNGTVQVRLISGPMPSGTIGLISNYDLNMITFYSVQKSGSFTRTDCPLGQVGGTINYIVPSYKYTSTISQGDADQKAQNDVGINGQNYANSNGACTTSVPITGSNSNSSGHAVVFTNSSNSSLTYSFYIYSGANNISLGSIPEGSYTVFFPEASATNVNFSIGIYSQTNLTTATFYDVSVTSTILARVY